MSVFAWFENFVGAREVGVVIHRADVGAVGEPWSVAMEWGKEAPDSPMVGAAAYGMGATLEEAVGEAIADCGYDKDAPTLTHGRHCLCSACANFDWTETIAPCGMHGASCPAVYAPIDPDRDRHYKYAARPT